MYFSAKTLKYFNIKLKNGNHLWLNRALLPQGGVSSETGSTGRRWLKIGAQIVKTDASCSNCHKDKLIRVSGLTLNDIKLTAYLDGKNNLYKKEKYCLRIWDRGPTVLNMSKDVGGNYCNGKW